MCCQSAGWLLRLPGLRLHLADGATLSSLRADRGLTCMFSTAYYGLPVREMNTPIVLAAFVLPVVSSCSSVCCCKNILFPLQNIYSPAANVTTHDIKCIKSFVAAEDKRSEGNSGVKTLYGK